MASTRARWLSGLQNRVTKSGSLPLRLTTPNIGFSMDILPGGLAEKNMLLSLAPRAPSRCFVVLFGFHESREAGNAFCT